jgi:hypothetical protein
MTIQDVHDALVSVRVAAELCGIPTLRVLSLIESKVIRTVRIQARQFVSLRSVELAIKEGDHDTSA